MNRRTLLQTLSAALLAGPTPSVLNAATSKGSPMLIVTVEVEFEDAGIHEQLAEIQAMDAATAEEPGCLAYRSSFDVTNPNLLRIYEMWESMEALTPHFQTPHMAKFQAALSGLNTKGMTAKVYEVAQELPFPNAG